MLSTLKCVQDPETVKIETTSSVKQYLVGVYCTCKYSLQLGASKPKLYELRGMALHDGL